MKAAVFENGRVSVRQAPLPETGENEALVKVFLAGICTTDIEILRGYAGFSGIAGHEFAGIVESAPGRPDLAGKRVVADINVGCGKCARCRLGDPRHCDARTVLGIRGRNGAFAEYCAVPVENLHVIPDTVETVRAVFAEPLAAALEITQQVHVANTDRVLVLGDGKMGILTALALQHASGSVFLAGRHPRKLAIAEKQGIGTYRIPAGTPAANAVEPPGRFDMVVEATGSPGGLQSALGLVRPEGTVVVKTTTRELSCIALSAVAVNEIHILGSRCGDMDLALRFLEKGWIDVMPLLEKIYPFSRFREAFDHAMQKGSLKVMVALNQGRQAVTG